MACGGPGPRLEAADDELEDLLGVLQAVLRLRRLRRLQRALPERHAVL